MYRTAIIGVNGRSGGQDATALAGDLLEEFAARTLVYVSELSPLSDQPTHYALERAGAEELGELLSEERRLAGAAAQIMRVGATTVGRGLEDVAERREADLVVVGASHRHGVRRLIDGDDVRAVLHNTSVAVAVAPPGYRNRRRLPHRIGIAYDASAQSAVAAAHGGLLAERFGSEIAALRAVHPSLDPPGWGLGDSKPRPLGPWHEHVDGVDVEVVSGFARGALRDFSGRIDLLVCGSRRQGPLRELLSGSTSQYLARHLEIPLIITPAEDSSRVLQWRERAGAPS